MMIIILDLDYTLLNDNGEIPEKNLKTLKKCKEKGDILIVNSARSYIRTKDIARQIDCDYINCFYGNMVVDKNGEILYSKAIPSQDVKILFRKMSKIYNGWAGIEFEKSSQGNDEEIAKKFGAKFNPNLMDCTESAFKFVFEMDESNYEKAVKIAEEYNLSAKFAREGYFCSFFPKNSNKWNGLRYILKKLGDNHGKTIAFGDDDTDLETFKNVDIPVAMKNSTQKVLDSVNNVTFSNNDAGVGRYLEKILTNRMFKSKNI